MHKNNIPFFNRCVQLGQRLRGFKPDRKETLFILGWGVCYIVIFWPISLLVNLLTFILYFFCWLKSADVGYRKLAPPGDLLVFVFFVLFAVFASIQPDNPVAIGSFPLLRVFNLALQGLLLIIFSLLLVSSEKGKKGGLVAYTLLFYMGLNVLYLDTSIYLVLLQVILFLIALRRTVWLETLTKRECYIYFGVFIVLFRIFWDLEPFADYLSDDTQHAYAWLGLPRFLYHAFLMYLLAVLVKTPIVLVYNFATLSRKLRISSFFQSTFPQIIQLSMLVIIFYFILAGWQAEKVRQATVGEISKIVEGRFAADIITFNSTRDDLSNALITAGYQPVRLDDTLPEYGVVALNRDMELQQLDESNLEQDFFLFAKTPRDDEQVIHFVRLDSTFLQDISDHTSILFGTHLRVSPYDPPPWEAFFLNFSLFTHNQLRISPFGLLPGRAKTALRVPLRQELEISELNIETVGERVPGSTIELIVGRVIAPLLSIPQSEAGFLVLEIALVPGSSTFLTPTLLSYVLLLAVAYTLVNMLVIRRMTKFGSEINRIIVQKFTQLRSGIQEISAGNLDYRLHIEGQDEFVELADHFNEMGGKLKKSIEETREKERMAQELTIARKVQLDLLPKKLPDIPGYEIAATLQTANEVGGDFYDIMPTGTDRFLVTIGDVSGKGTSAALYMAQCVSLIRYSHQFIEDPCKMAGRLNHYFANPAVDRQIFITAIIGILDTRKNSFEFVRAGHLPPLFISCNSKLPIKEVASGGLGLGLEAGKAFDKALHLQSVQFQVDDTLVLFTDGIVEASRPRTATVAARNSDMVTYGDERFIPLLESLRTQSAGEIERAIKLDINSFYERSPFIDDYTIVILQRKTP